jgi:hypothetical protein
VSSSPDNSISSGLFHYHGAYVEIGEILLWGLCSGYRGTANIARASWHSGMSSKKGRKPLATPSAHSIAFLGQDSGGGEGEAQAEFSREVQGLEPKRGPTTKRFPYGYGCELLQPVFRFSV